MPEIARLNPDGTVACVEPCCDEDHKTCPVAMTVALDDNHDMRERGNGYRWDFQWQCFLPLNAPILEEPDTAELVEGIVETIEALGDSGRLQLPRRMKRALAAYRRHVPRRPEIIEMTIEGGEPQE